MARGDYVAKVKQAHNGILYEVGDAVPFTDELLEIALDGDLVCKASELPKDAGETEPADVNLDRLKVQQLRDLASNVYNVEQIPEKASKADLIALIRSVQTANAD